MLKIFLVLYVLPIVIARMHSFSSGSLLSKEAHVKTKDVDAVEGKSVSLPCPITAPLTDVYMVLWFRDSAGIPLYSFDVRDKLTSDQPRHWSAPEVFGSRAKFHFETEPATLEIKDIKRHDQGIYRCRIDFRTSQTQSFRFNLSVIILPEQPIILDRWGRQLNGTQLGPKQEGDDIVITCRVVGGRPQPQVRWLVNGLLVDNQYEHNSGDVIENRLLWPSVQRTDLNSVFTCQALNTQLDKPKEKSFILDMHLKPLTIKIMDPPSSMVADRRYEVICESTGSRPNAIITWYKGKRQLRRTKDDITNNTTRSELSFVPTTDDDGKSITCRAENPNVNGLYLETMWKLNVVYPPLVTLRLGSTLSPDDIKEGDDVYFECHVQSNPQWRKLLWLHNGVHLEHNTSARVIRSNQSLVLQKITKQYAGNYACSAINDEGETVSNQLPLRIKYVPICKHSDRVILIGATKDETVEVVCEIQADPPPKTFRWKFNNSGETIDVGSERFSVNDSRSLLKYTPVTDQDYGTLSCWAANDVGTQNQPCLFQVVLAVLPNAVSNCTIFNRTELSADIQCIPGYDGGLPQIFVLEMISMRTGMVRFNVTNPEEPQFTLENLDSLNSMMTQENNSLKLRIYALNQKGRSQSYVIHDLIIGSTSFKSDEDMSFTISPAIVGSVLTIVVISLAIAIRIFVLTFLHNLRHNRQHSAKATVAGVVAQAADVLKSGNMEKPRWQHTDIKSKSSEELVEDERDPDVIPAQYGNSSSSSVQNPHFKSGPQTKWSPTSNHNMAAAYDKLLKQTKTGQKDANDPITFKQINARTQLVTSAASTLLPNPLFQKAEVSSAAIGLNPSSSTTTITGVAHLQQQLLASEIEVGGGSGVGGGGGGIGGGESFPAGLGSATSYNANSDVLAYGLHYGASDATGSGSSNHMYNNKGLQQPHYSHMRGHNMPSVPIISHTASILSTGGCENASSTATAYNSGIGLTATATAAKLGCNPGTDLDDNININAIKDCLMTQRVPESCV